MSRDWIENGDRLVNAVGEILADEILDIGYTSIIANIKRDGTIRYRLIDNDGVVLSDTFDPLNP